jgi:hypothetical protein
MNRRPMLVTSKSLIVRRMKPSGGGQRQPERSALVVQRQQLIGTQGKLGVGLPIVVAKLDFVHPGVQNLNHGPDFTGLELARREVFRQRHGVQ